MPLYLPSVPTGTILPYVGSEFVAVPPGYLFAQGSTQSRTTYAGLFGVLVPNLGTITVTIAGPAVVTYSGITIPFAGEQIFFTTTGALPTGLAANTLYYLGGHSGTSYNLATTRANAYSSTFITTTGTQSGTHTMWYCPYGLGDGSTTFGIPDTRGVVLAGVDNNQGILNLGESQGTYGNQGASGGEQGHTLSAVESGTTAHTHTWNSSQFGTTGVNTYLGNTSGSAVAGVVNAASASAASNAHNNVQPTLVINYIIKT